MLFDNKTSVHPLSGVIRSEHAQSFDQQVTWAAVDLTLFGVAAERTSVKAIRFRFFLSLRLFSIGLGLSCFRIRLLGVGLNPGCSRLGRLDACTRCRV